MKKLIYLFTTTLLLFAAPAEALQCEALFPPPFAAFAVKSESTRVALTKMSADDVNSKLIVQALEFSTDPEAAAIEMVRMLVQNTDFKLEDKNVLTKNKFTLGIPLKDGYSLQLNYESKSNVDSRFILQDKITLVTPTGKEFKITDELIDLNQLKLSKTEFDLKTFFEPSFHVHLQVPLIVDGALLKRFTQLANYFEYFEKDEIRALFKTSSMTRIQTMFKLRKAKKVFFDVLIKEPFKAIIGGAIMFAVINSQVITTEVKHNQVQSPAPIVQSYVSKTINDLPIPAQQIEVRDQLNALRNQAAATSQNHLYSNIRFKDIPVDPSNIFSNEHNIFVFDKINENTNSKHTYIVFSQDISQNRTPGMQYFLMEVNAAKYAQLITYLKSQGNAPVVIKKAEVTK